jgi:hypothetical protein
MFKHYSYRMDHDTGFAPNPNHGICTLGGCKVNTVERWASKGSWIVGIGGNGTGQPNKLIYAMEVEESLTFQEFGKRYPQKSRYLRNSSVNKVLVSRKFFYFGDSAIVLPEEIGHIIISGRGCKRIDDKDILKLNNFLLGRYKYGVMGKPNNTRVKKLRTKCLCSSYDKSHGN